MKSDFVNDSRNKKEHEYLENVMKENEGKLPKSTTCCWSLGENLINYVMKQCFVSVNCKFALDLLSNVLKDCNNWGATIISSMFGHCISILICIYLFNNVYLKGPINMYNFT